MIIKLLLLLLGLSAVWILPAADQASDFPACIRLATDVSTNEQAESVLKKCRGLTAQEKLVVEGMVRFQLALSGDDAAVQTAMEANRAAWEAAAMPLSRGYLGGSQILMSWHLFQSERMGEAMALIQEGMDNLDKAIEAGPDEPLLRVMRCECYWNMSNNSPITRFETIRADVAAMETMGKKLNQADTAFVHLFRGFLSEMDGDAAAARKHFQAAVKLGKGDDSAQRAQEKLNRK